MTLSVRAHLKKNSRWRRWSSVRIRGTSYSRRSGTRKKKLMPASKIIKSSRLHSLTLSKMCVLIKASHNPYQMASASMRLAKCTRTYCHWTNQVREGSPRSQSNEGQITCQYWTLTLTICCLASTSVWLRWCQASQERQVVRRKALSSQTCQSSP